MNEDDLRAFLVSVLGEVGEVEVARAKNKESKGYGFFIVEDTMAQRVVSLVNEKPCQYGDVTRNVVVSLARKH